MPNWCWNFLTIKGNKQKLNELKQFVKSKDRAFDFEKIISQKESEGYKIFKKKWEKLSDKEKLKWKWDNSDDMNNFIFNEFGYNWNMENWGTKWNSCESSLIVRDNNLNYHFSTAWTPPTPVIEALISMFPELEFRMEFEEGGVGFMGKITGKDGQPRYEEWKANSYECDVCGCSYLYRADKPPICPDCFSNKIVEEM